MATTTSNEPPLFPRKSITKERAPWLFSFDSADINSLKVLNPNVPTLMYPIVLVDI